MKICGCAASTHGRYPVCGPESRGTGDSGDSGAVSVVRTDERRDSDCGDTSGGVGIAGCCESEHPAGWIAGSEIAVVTARCGNGYRAENAASAGIVLIRTLYAALFTTVNGT